ncbi:MAG: hypothetical protein LQ347_003649 [Umbilicaria vellea]|nr:MAG: hypothetical protein LQ347_003649 [Umbilicaria vellea]
MAKYMEPAANLAQAAGSFAVNWASAHPYKAGASAISIGLTPILGPGWVIALPLKAAGFGAAGVGGGTLAAWWQATAYGGFVPAGSAFAVLQWAGATVGI